ncbi:MAG: transglutaminase-like domain-containing protein, partial [Candidatus Methylomirabilota bacterium]
MRILSPSVTVVLLLFLVNPAAPAARRDPAPVPDEVVRKLVHEPLAHRSVPPPRTFRAHMAQTLGLLDRIGAEESRGAGLSATSRMLLESKRHELATLWAELEAGIATAHAALDAADGGAGRGRRSRTAAALRVRFAALGEALGAMRDSRGTDDRRRTREALVRELRRLQAKAAEQDNTVPLPPAPTLRTPEPLQVPPEPGNAPPPQYARYRPPLGPLYASTDAMLAQVTPPPEANVCVYTQADLASTPDAPITQEIRDLAASLDYAPRRIYEYVKNEIAFEPYYGSLKGATGLLYSKAGNSTDQASLLIALLRASGFPARYVKGAIQFSNDPRLLQWLGVKDYPAAEKVLQYGTIPAARTGTQVWFTHVWAETCVPFGWYRGAGAGKFGYRWIPLDASFKEMVYQPGIGVSSAMDYGTDAGQYMHQRTDVLPHERYEEMVDAEIKAADPNATLGDVPYAGTPVPSRIDVLPVSLPYEVLWFNAWTGSASAEVAALPNSHRYGLKVEVQNASGAPLITPTVLLFPEIALQRVTLAFQGSTPGYEALLQEWRTQDPMTAGPPCGIGVVPVLRTEGSERAVGTGSVDLCEVSSKMILSLTVDEIQTGSPPIPVVINQGQFGIRAANYYAIQAYAFQASDRLLTERAARLLASVRSTPNPNTNPEETEAEYLHLVGLKWMCYASDALRTIGRLRGETGHSGTHLGVTTTQSKVEYLLDEPFAVYRRGFLIDVPAFQYRSADLHTGLWTPATGKLIIYSVSALESYIWQENAMLDAVSAVRGMQYAREIGIEILAGITSENWATESAKLSNNTTCPNHTPADIAAIQAYVNDGYTVSVPRCRIEYGEFAGAVWMAERADGMFGALISGGYSGGFTTNVVLIIYDEGTAKGWDFEGVTPLTTPTDPDAVPPEINSGQGNGITRFTVTAGDPVNMVTGNLVHT